MPPTFTELVEHAVTDNLSTYTTGSYTPTANKHLVALVIVDGSNGGTGGGSASGNGLTWTTQTEDTGTTNYIAIFTAPTGASPSAGGFTVDVTGDAGTGALIVVLEVDGLDGTAPFTQANWKRAASGAPNVDFSAATASDCAVAAIARVARNPAALDPPTGYTETADTGHPTPAQGMEACYHASPGSFTTLTWATDPAVGWAAAAIEMKPAAAGAATSLLVPTPSIHYLLRR